MRTPTFWLVTLLLSLVALIPAHAETTKLGHLRLIDRLDRPQDGYCLDILGVGQNMRLELPIFAHNCKPGLTPDSALEQRDDGTYRFAAVDLCITAAGVNGRALPGASIILRPCGHNAPFFESGPLQKFERRANGQLTLQSTNLCLAAGTVSATTYSEQDRWRVLTVEDCKSIAPSLSRWEFNTGPFR